jgi:tRNA threonylcarbamoyladenosine biosynthesis protein TsaE
VKRSAPDSHSADTWTVIVGNRAAACRLGRSLGRTLGPGSILALVGELGAGKTTLVQAIAAGLEIPELQQVLSPTFTLVNEYAGGRLPLVHLDFYRLESAGAAEALGLDEILLRRDALVAIEWADHLPTLIPEDAVWVRFEWQGRARRTITVTGCEKPRGLRLPIVGDRREQRHGRSARDRSRSPAARAKKRPSPDRARRH